MTKVKLNVCQPKKGAFAFLIATVTLSPFPVVVQAQVSEIAPSDRDFTAVVSGVNHFGQLEFGEEERYRLFGIYPKPGFVDFVQSEIVGREMSCNYVGQTGFKAFNPSSFGLTAIDCSFPNSRSGYGEISVQHFLILEDVAGQNCSESQSSFGPCER